MSLLEGAKSRLARLVGRVRGAVGRYRRTRRARTPTVLQMEAVECGAACLGIVLGHFGCWVALEELRTACGVSRDGSKASKVLKAARRYGLRARGMKTEPKALRAFQPPMILHWNFNHFVVLEGFGRNRVYLNDPATGPRTITEEELDLAFTGVVLTFGRGEDFAPTGTPPRLLPALGRRLAGSWRGVTFVLLAGLVLVLPGLAVPVFSQLFIDGVLLDGRLRWLPPLLLAMGLTGALLGALTWLQQSHLLRLETKIALASSGRFLWHVLRLPVDFFNQRLIGDVAARVAANDRVARLLSRDLATHTVAAVTALLFLVVMVQYDLLLTVVVVSVATGNLVVLRWVSRRRKDASRRLLQEKGKLSGATAGGLQTIETVKASGEEEDLFSRWTGYQAKVVRLRQDLERSSHVLAAVPAMLTALNTALVLGIGGLRVIQGSLTLGGLVAFQLLMASFTAPIQRLVGLGGQLQTVHGDMNRLDDVLQYPVEVEADAPPPPPGTPAKLAGRLELRGITFGYGPLDPPLLEGFDLELAPGSRVALVGRSGSGKSTVSRLVSGLWEPWEGEILFDGRPRSEIPPALLANSLAAVDQTITLFEGTVQDNLTLWDETVPLPEVVRAARDAAIHEEIVTRPGGYQAMVAEEGRNWSGGQRQRLEIARALVGAPSVLILDEATSALDPETEQIIDRALRRRGCTCLIVAHRLSTIRDADEIVVLDHGEVVERGRHEELLAADGEYARLVSEP